MKLVLSLVIGALLSSTTGLAKSGVPCPNRAAKGLFAKTNASGASKTAPAQPTAPAAAQI